MEIIHVDAKHHAWLARTLINACGGLPSAAERCRVAKSRLSHYQDPNRPDDFMPADVIECLESYCGEPHYSRALMENAPGALADRQLVDEACDATEAAAALQRLIRTRGSAWTRVLIEEGLADIDLVESHARAARELLTRGAS